MNTANSIRIAAPTPNQYLVSIDDIQPQYLGGGQCPVLWRVVMRIMIGDFRGCEVTGLIRLDKPSDHRSTFQKFCYALEVVACSPAEVNAALLVGKPLVVETGIVCSSTCMHSTVKSYFRAPRVYISSLQDAEIGQRQFTFRLDTPGQQT